ncbi:GA module-containing protein [Mycoplasmopsis verecunda]|uniref:GA module n=1 Tax=Mycoplasmopsis verecunda TaxID=171291 RepID=A0A1T4KHE8_9BACT|nr:GA module-containing protein [Mycoplasmopsis verecunda]WPB54240.1 GA module-containing protein [Mycoplasmopsis verecunda]SJZ41852.1 GA module [Mycoplasmopsis verecunda]
MQKNRKSLNRSKLILTVVASSPILAIPLLVSASSTLENRIFMFNPDKTYDVNNDFQHRTEYEHLPQTFFGFAHYKYKTMPNNQTSKLVKFIKTPTQDEWNNEEQTWTLMFETGALDNEYYEKGKFWHNEYPFGQRVYGFALSDDLELVPGTVSVKFENAGSEKEISDVNAIDESIRRNGKYGIQGEPFANGVGQYYDNGQEWNNEKFGAYVRFADAYGNFDQSAEQTFNNQSIPHDNKNDYIQITQNFDTNNGTNSRGDLFTDFSNDPNAPAPLHLYTIPKYSGFSDDGESKYLPGINGVEYITSDVAFREKQKAFTPAEINDALSRTKTTDDKMPRRIFGIGIGNLMNEHSDRYNKANGGYNPFYNNIGSAFLIHYQTGLELNRYSYNLRPIPVVTMQFKTRRKYTDVLVNSDDSTFSKVKQKENAYLNKANSHYSEKSFVAGMFHSDKYENHDNIWKKNSNEVDLDTASLGNTKNQYTGVAFQFANRSFNRTINIELTEKYEQTFDVNKKDEFPEITGYKIMYKDKEVDHINIPWESSKNTPENEKTRTYRTLLKNFKMNTTDIYDYDNLKVVPIIKSKDDQDKWTTTSTSFKLKPISNRFEVEVTYKPSEAFIEKQDSEKLKLDKLKAKLTEQVDNSEILNKNSQNATSLKQWINNSNDFSALNGAEESISALIDALNGLYNKLQIVQKQKETDVYKQSDNQGNKAAFDNAITQAEGFLSNNLPTYIKSATESKETKIEILKSIATRAIPKYENSLTTAYNDLSGHNKINAAIEEAKKNINNLNSITDDVKKEYKDKLDGMVNLSDINQVVSEATTYNSNVSDINNKLQNHIQFANDNNQESDFNKSSTILKDRFNNRIKELEKLYTSGKANLNDLSKYKHLISDLDNTKESIHNYNLESLKAEIKTKVDQIDVLTEKQKSSLINQINKTNDKKDIEDVSLNVNTLIDGFQQLKNSVEESKKLKNKTDYLKADEAAKKTFDDKLNEASNLLEEFSKKNDLSTTKELDKLTTQAATADTALNNAKGNLNGKDNYLNEIAKTITKIKQLSNLSTQLQNQIIEEIKLLTDSEAINTKVKSAEELNTKAGELLEQLTKYNNLHSSADHNFVDKTVQANLATYNESITPLLSDNKVNVNNIEEISRLASALKTTLDSIQEPLAQLKTKFSESLQNAKKAQNAMSLNYFNASEEKKDALDKAIEKSNKYLTEYTENGSSQLIQILISGLNTAVSSLDGISKVRELFTQPDFQNLPENIKTQVINVALAQQSQENLAQVIDAVKLISKALGNLEKSKESITSPYTNKSSNYTQANSDAKEKYKNNIENYDSNLATILAQQVNSLDDIKTLGTKITTFADNLSNSHNNLDGIKRLQNAIEEQKKSANASLSLLSDDLKAKIWEPYKNIDFNTTKLTLDDIANNFKKYQQINDKMSEITVDIYDFKDTVANNTKYSKATEQTKKLVNTAVQNINNLITNYDSDSEAMKASGNVTSNLDLSNLLSQYVTPAKEAINSDYQKWLTHKEMKVKAIEKLSDLSSKQRDALTKQLDSNNDIEELDKTEKTAVDLNTAMNLLSEAVNKAKSIQSQNVYIYATKDKKDAFDTVANSNELDKLDKEKQTSIVPQEINKKANDVSEVTNGLNGDEKLAKIQKEAKESINNSTLSQDQKDNINELITNATNKDTIESIVEKVSQLTNAISNLDDSIKKANEEKTKQNYTEATAGDNSVKDVFDKQLQDSNTVSSEAKAKHDFTNANDIANLVTSINDSKDKLNKAKSNLNGEINFLTVQTKAKEEINKLTALESSDKGVRIRAINEKNTIAEINQVVLTAKEQDKAGNNLLSKLAEANALIADETKYQYTTPEQQKALNKAISWGKQLLQYEKYIKPWITVEVMQKATNDIASVISDINGLSDDITKAKEEVDKLNNLTGKQKDYIKSHIASKTTKDDINSELEKAKELDKSTKEFKDALKSANNVDKDANNYKLADVDKQNEFNKAQKDATEVLDNLAGNTKEQIDTLTSKLNNAKDNLNGDSNLVNKKAEEKAKVEKLDKLSDKQKNVIKNSIDSANTPQDAEKLSDAANKLQDALSKADKELDSANKEKDKPSYTEATNKEDLNTSETQLSDANTKAKENTDLNNVEKINALVNDLNEKSSDVNDKVKALDGNDVLDKAKKEVNKLVDNLNNLSDEAKDTIKKKLSDANTNTVEKVNAIKNDASKLNTKAGELANAISTLDSLAKTNKVDTLDQDTKDSIPTVLNDAKDLIDNNKLKDNVTIDSIDENKAKLNAIINSINKGADTLDKYKSDKKEALNKLENLSQSQKNDLLGEISRAATSENIDQVITKASALNGAMKKLQDAIKNLKAKQDSKDVALASEQPKEAFDKLATPESLANNEKEKISTINANEIEEKVKAISKVLSDLDGNNNLAKAQNDIASLTNLSSEHKDKFTAELDKVNNKAALDNLVSNAKEIDKYVPEITQLSNNINSLANRFKPAQTSENLQAVQDLLNEIANTNTKLESLKAEVTKLNESKDLQVKPYKDLKDKLTQAVTKANETIGKVKAKVSNILDKAATYDIHDEALKAIAQAKANELKNDSINLNTALDNVRTLEAIPYRDKYKDVVLNAPEKLQKSPSWITNSINKANDEISKAFNAQQDQAILDKLTHQLDKELLAYAYDNAVDIVNNRFNNDLAVEKQKALEMLDYNTISTKDQYDAQADKLNWLAKASSLDALVDKINNQIVKPFSNELTSAIVQANDALNNKATPIAKLDELIDKLNKLMIQEPLNKSVQNAKETIKQINDKLASGEDKKLQKDKDKLDKLIKEAEKLINSDKKVNTKEILDKSDEINKAIADAISNISTFDDVLSGTIKQAEKLMDSKSKALQESIDQAKALSPNASNKAKKDALDHLIHKIHTNDLDKVIEAAPEIKEGIYKNITPNELPKSQAISNNTSSTKAQVNDATDKQRLNNKQIEVINSVYDFDALNKAQKDKFVADVSNAKEISDIDKLVSSATILNEAMKSLHKANDEIQPEYKTQPINSATFINSTKAEQDKVSSLISDVKALVNGDGIVYKNNDASEITALSNSIKEAINNLSGKNKALNDAARVEELIPEITKLENVNANKLENSPKALSQEFNKVLDEIKAMQEVKDNPLAFSSKGGVEKLESLVANAKRYYDEINKFSSNDFRDVQNNSITQAKDFANSNSDALNDKFIKNKLDEFDNQMTYANAISKLNELQAQNNKANDEINVLKIALKDIIANSQDNELENVIAQIKNMKPYANEAKTTELLSVIKAIPSLVQLQDKLNKVLNSNATAFGFDKKLNNVINSANGTEYIKGNHFNDVAMEYSKKLDSIKHNANALKTLIKAIKEKNKDQLLLSTTFDESLSNNNEFRNKLIEINYAEKHNDPNVMNEFVNSNTYNSASKALQSLITVPDQNDQPTWLWPYYASMSAVMFLLGIIGIAKFKKSKK